jgi:[protein-PII] uridylyltransferase
MNFADEDIETISFLIREHLLLTKTATQRDLNDEKVVVQCARKFKVYHILKKGELATPAAVDIVAKKRKEIFLESLSMPQEDLELLFDQLSPRYLLYTPAKDILRHIELYQRLGKAPFVLEAQTLPGTNYRTVAVCAKDRPGLFSKISGVFTLNNLASLLTFLW